MSDEDDFGDDVRSVVLSGLTVDFGEGTLIQGEAFGFGSEVEPGAPRGKAASRRGLKRPGQWGWRAREKRFLRLFQARSRRVALLGKSVPRLSRRGRRYLDRFCRKVAAPDAS